MIPNPHFLNANMYIPPSRADYIPGNNPKPGAVTVIRAPRPLKTAKSAAGLSRGSAPSDPFYFAVARP